MTNRHTVSEEAAVTPIAGQSAELSGSVAGDNGEQVGETLHRWSPRTFQRLNLAAAIGAFLLSVVVIVASRAYAMTVGKLPGPGLYPTILGFALAILSVIWIIGSIMNRYQANDESEPPPDRGAFVRTLLSLFAILAFAIVLGPLGYPIAATLLVAVLMWLGGGGPIRSIITGVIFGFGTFIMVTTWLGIQLDLGPLEPYLYFLT